MKWIVHIISISSVLDKIIVSTQVHWGTYSTTDGIATLPLYPFDGLVVILFRVYLHRIGHIISINSVLDKIMVSTQVPWSLYVTAVGTAAPLLHPFDGSAVTLFQVYLHIGYVMNRTQY